MSSAVDKKFFSALNFHATKFSLSVLELYRKKKPSFLLPCDIFMNYSIRKVWVQQQLNLVGNHGILSRVISLIFYLLLSFLFHSLSPSKFFCYHHSFFLAFWTYSESSMLVHLTLSFLSRSPHQFLPQFIRSICFDWIRSKDCQNYYFTRSVP